MKLTKFSFQNFKKFQAFTPVLVVGFLMLTGAVIYNFGAHAATGGFSFSSSATSYQVGDTVTVGVYENSGSECTNVVQTDFSYPANLLRYDAISSDGGKFESSVQTNSGNGTVSLVNYTTAKACGTGNTLTSGVSGQQLVGNVSFTVIGTGTATLNYNSSSIAVSSADNKTNVSAGGSSKTFTLTAATSPTPTPPTPTPPSPEPTPSPNPTPTPTPTPSPTPTPTPTRTTTGTSSNSSAVAVTSITPVDTDTSIAATDNDTVEVTTPVEVNPLPIQPDGINKIEYYLNGKLVSTVKTAPYTYKMDTTKLLNGNYTMTTKTYYLNGQVKSVSQTMVVKNPFGFTQLKLRAKKLAWLIILLVIIAAAAVAAWLIHKRGHGSGDDYNDSGSYDGGSGTPDPAVYAPAAPEAGVIRPNAPSSNPPR